MKMLSFTMLLRALLLTILVPVALGAPVSQESSPPTLSLVSGISDAKVTDGLSRSEVDHANKVGWHLEGNKIVIGSKTRSNGKGSPLLDGHSAHGTGVSNIANALKDKGAPSINGWTNNATSQRTTKLGLNHANKMNKQYKGRKGLGGSQTGGYAARGTGLSDSGALGGTSGGISGGASGGNSGGMTGSEGTTTGNATTTATTTGSYSTVSGTATSGDEFVPYILKHR